MSETPSQPDNSDGVSSPSAEDSTVADQLEYPTLESIKAIELNSQSAQFVETLAQHCGRGFVYDHRRQTITCDAPAPFGQFMFYTSLMTLYICTCVAVRKFMSY